MMILFEDNPCLGETVIMEASQLLPLFDEALRQAEKLLLEDLSPKEKVSRVSLLMELYRSFIRSLPLVG